MMSSNINIISTSKGDDGINPTPKSLFNGDNGAYDLSANGGRVCISNLHNTKNYWRTHSKGQEMHQGLAEEFSRKVNFDRPQIHSLQVADNTENLYRASDRKLSSTNRLEGGSIFKNVGNSHVMKSHMLFQITHWLNNLHIDMYNNNKKSPEIQEDINRLMKRADDLTVGFLGCLCIFEYKKPQWKDISDTWVGIYEKILCPMERYQYGRTQKDEQQRTC